jgi:uncharacterized membrane protein
MRVCEAITVSASPDQVWDVVSDPERVLSFMEGVTRWEVVSPQPTGLGARYRVLFRVGSAEIGGLIEVVEWSPGRELAWTSVTGVDQRGRWRLRDRGAQGTRVEIRLAYGVAGSGLAGWIAERIAAPAVKSHLRSSLRQLKRLVEYAQLREQAAAGTV